MSVQYKKIYSFILLMPLFLLLLGSCSSPSTSNSKAEKENTSEINKTPYEDKQFLMGTYVQIKIYDKDKEAVLKKAFDRVKVLADKITVNEAGSEIDKINEAAGIRPVKVSNDVYPLIKKAYQYSDTNTGFDMAIGPITQLWHIGFPDARKPEDNEIQQALSLVNYKKVQLNDKEQTVYLEDKGMSLDLGAIAKGYITDEVVKLLKANKVSTAIVDLGGNVYVLGQSPRKANTDWTVGIQDPKKDRNTVVGSIPASNQSLVTSGIYERYLTIDDQTYHHLFDPKTGYPFNNDLAGVTIISDKSIDGDGLSTLIFSLGVKDGLAYIDHLNNVEAVFVTKNDEIYLSKGLQNKFKLNDESHYKLKSTKELK